MYKKDRISQGIPYPGEEEDEKYKLWKRPIKNAKHKNTKKHKTEKKYKKHYTSFGIPFPGLELGGAGWSTKCAGSAGYFGSK